jgi:hypothetical protein
MLIQIMSDLRPGRGAEGIVKSAVALRSDFSGGAPDRPSRTTGINAP